MPAAKRRSSEEPRKGAPRYLVSYSGLFTLLLAFFIILQSFATVQQPGLFYAGQGSFIRALETGGLGGIWEQLGLGRDAPRYLAPEGQEEPPRSRRIDPELEEGQAAVRSLAEDKRLVVRETVSASAVRRVLPMPVSFDPAKTGTSEQEEAFLRSLAPAVGSLLRAGRCAVGIGAEFSCSDADEPIAAARALEAAEQVRAHLAGAMGEPHPAAGQLYAYARRVQPAAGREPLAPGLIKVYLLLNRIGEAEGVAPSPSGPRLGGGGAPRDHGGEP